MHDLFKFQTAGLSWAKEQVGECMKKKKEKKRSFLFPFFSQERYFSSNAKFIIKLQLSFVAGGCI